MKKLIYINGCIRGKESRTKRIADPIIQELSKRYDVKTIDLTNTGYVPVNTDYCKKRNNGHVPADIVALSKEIANADRIVIASPFWDMSFPSILKVFIEQMSLFHITFDSNDHECYGLCKCERLMLITTRGMNIKTGDELEQATPYLKAVSRLWGLGELTTIACENFDYLPQETIDKKIEDAVKKGIEIAQTF